MESGPWGPLTAGCTRVVLIFSLQELQDCFQTNAQNVAEGGGAGSDHSQVKKACLGFDFKMNSVGIDQTNELN